MLNRELKYNKLYKIQDINVMTDLVDETKCPICGNNNSCHIFVKDKTAQNTCWCENTEYAFPVDLFTRIPAKFKDKACICKSCAQVYRKTRL